MKIPKLLPVLCAFTAAACCLTVRAEDNSDQAAARIALAKQLFETSGQSSGGTNAASENSSVNKSPVVETAMKPVTDKEARANARAEKSAAAARAKQDAADLKAKNQADKKMAQQSAAAAQAESKARTDSSAASAAMKSEDEKRADAEKAALSVATDDAHAINAAQATTNATPMKAKPLAKSKKVKKQKSASGAQPASGPSDNAADANYIGKDLGMKQIAAPPLPINASKETRLQALLDKYKADQISPEQYHQQRAAILDEP